MPVLFFVVICCLLHINIGQHIILKALPVLFMHKFTIFFQVDFFFIVIKELPMAKNPCTFSSH